jgi:hypothetical protein
VQGEDFSHGDFQFSILFLFEISVNVLEMIPFFFFGKELNNRVRLGEINR